MRTLAASLVLLSLLLAACEPTEPPEEPAPEPEPEPEPVLPACDEPGSLYGLDAARQPFELVPGAEVPVILGFQGFLFLEVGLRSTQKLPGSMDVITRVQVESGVDLTATNPGILAAQDGAGWKSDPVLVFFNDVPLVDLHGRRATLGVGTATPTCVLSASAEVLLVDGGVMQGP